MKKVLFALLISIAPLLINAQVFLQGTNLEVGIHSAGSFGGEVPPPAGYHAAGDSLGLIFDFGYNGWETGTPPFMGDYFVPGSPEEGWGIEWNQGATSYNFNNFGLNYYFDIPLTSMSDVSTASVKKCKWNGTAGSGAYSLEIRKTYTFGLIDYFIVIDVCMVNTGTQTLESLEYLRNIDPDNEIDWTGDYTTKNYVLKQPGTGTNPDTAIVCARGLIYNRPIYLLAVNPDARGSCEGFSNRDPDDIFDSPIAPPIASPSIFDEAIALAFRCGDLAPGDSVNIAYLYAFDDKILLNDAIFSYLTHNNTVENGVSGFNVFPNPATEMINITVNSIENINLKAIVYDVFGRKADVVYDDFMTSGYNSFDYNTSNLKSGIYYIRFEYGGKSTVKKLIKI